MTDILTISVPFIPDMPFDGRTKLLSPADFDETIEHNGETYILDEIQGQRLVMIGGEWSDVGNMAVYRIKDNSHD